MGGRNHADTKCYEARAHLVVASLPRPVTLASDLKMPFPSVNRSRASVDISWTEEQRAVIPKRRGSISGGVAPSQAAPAGSAIRVTAPSSSSSTMSSPSKWQAATLSKRLLPPPETPTRRLLQRIQRRSSTSAESIVLTRKLAPRGNGPTASASITPLSLRQVRQQPDEKELRSFGVRRDSLAGQRPDVSTMSLPRHARTRSMLVVNGPPKAMSSNVAGKVAISVAVEKYITPEEQSMALPNAVSVPLLPPSSSIVSTTEPDDETLANLDRATSPDDLSSSELRVADSETVEDVKEIVPPNGEAKPKKSPLQRSPSGIARPPLPSSPQLDVKALSLIDPRSRTDMLREAAAHGIGLTREAAKSLEQEFSSQERILQGLQRDNERKTVEVEEMRRQKARLEEFCARHFGAEHWRDVVFGTAEQSRSAIKRGNDETSEREEQKVGLQTPQQFSTAQSSAHDLDDQSCSSQVIVEGLLRTLSSPSITSQLCSPAAVPADQATPMVSRPAHGSNAPARATTLTRPRTPPVCNADPASRRDLPFDSSCMSVLDDASFASALDASTVVERGNDEDDDGAKGRSTIVSVPRAALQAVMDAQRQLLLAVQTTDGVV